MSWTCPDCDRTFANTNQWHACTTRSTEDFLADCSDVAVACWHAVADALAGHGTFRVHATKTRIACIRHMTFAGVSPATRWADLSFILPGPLDDRRVRRLEVYGPTSFGHTIRLEGPSDVDDDVRAWLGDALHRGDGVPQTPVSLPPLSGHAASVATIPMAARVALEGGRRVVAIPGWAVELLGGPGASATVRLLGEEHRATVGPDHLDPDGDALAASGLGDGDPVDAVARPA